MTIFKTVKDLQSSLDTSRKNGMSIGFVPTMGALHDGHLSLIKNSKSDSALTVCSIFINPTQFNDPKDYEKYPVSINQDIYKLEANDCDVLFIPSIDEIYPQQADKNKHYDLGELETTLEGKFRPGHFQGVCMVVERLLRIVNPDTLYLGQKDYQQCMVIRKLTELMGIDKKLRLKISPTIRESDGLAMSSRNLRLNEKERSKANSLYEALVFAKNNIAAMPLKTLKQQTLRILQEKGFNVDYFEIADAQTLELLERFDAKNQTVALVAAHLNDVRLIDNMLLN